MGRDFTKRQASFLMEDKEYDGVLKLGVETTSYDVDGDVCGGTDKIPTLKEVEEVIQSMQGAQQQIAPMFSAKKINGVRLADLARNGIEVERKPVNVHMEVTLLEYNYPLLSNFFLILFAFCSSCEIRFFQVSMLNVPKEHTLDLSRMIWERSWDVEVD